MTKEYGDFFRGIGNSKYDQTAFHTLIGCDVHSETGSLTCSKAMVDTDGGGIVTGECNCACTLPNGDSLFAGDAGKIYKVTSAGTVTLVHTFTAGAEVYGIGYLDDYVYYCSAGNIGRQTVAHASSEASWSSQADTWDAFDNSSTYKPMVKQNLSLFIGDGKYVAAVDEAGAFSSNALDLEENHIISALTKAGEGILIGTTDGTTANRAGLFWWDTYSSSWTIEDSIDESGIATFIPADNVIYIVAGVVGNVYYWSGDQAILFKRLKDAGTTVTTAIAPYTSANLNGLPLVATIRGIYSLGRSETTLPVAQVIEYVPSVGQGTTLGAMVAVGSQIFVSFKSGASYGIDKLSTNLYSGKIITPLIFGKVNRASIYYSSLPASTSITAKTSEDGGVYATKALIKDATDQDVYRFATRSQIKSRMQIEYTLVAATTTAPRVFNIEVR